MRIKLVNSLGTFLSDTYPEADAYYDDSVKSINKCLQGELLAINMIVDKQCVIIPAEIVKQSVITIINETETKE
jgi:hypothetical protein